MCDWLRRGAPRLLICRKSECESHTKRGVYLFIGDCLQFEDLYCDITHMKFSTNVKKKRSTCSNRNPIVSSKPCRLCKGSCYKFEHA